MLAVAAALVVSACGQQQPVRLAAAVPERILPAHVAGLDAKQEPSAQRAFQAGGKHSLTAHGAVWTLRAAGAVQGALQVGVLKPGHDTKDIDVRRGIRSTIQTGQYRWFKVDGQWIGVQTLPELNLYLWFPPRGDLYEILQVQPKLADQKDLLAQILRYQKGSA